MGIVTDRLDGPTVIATIEQLERRITARFPERGLRRAAAELASAAQDIERLGAQLQGRLRAVRWVAGAVSLVVVAGMVLVVVIAARETDVSGSIRSMDWVALVESTIQTLVFGGLTLLFRLVGTVAALTAEESQAGLTLETVSDIENLTTGMSRKIWQKITLLSST